MKLNCIFIIFLSILIVLIHSKDDNLPLLSVVHLTAPFDSHIRGAAMTISSFIINIPKYSNLIADYFLIMPKYTLNSQLCSSELSSSITNFNLWCLDELKVLNITRDTLKKYVGAPNKKKGNTWRLQMLIKIFASTRIRTKYFIIVDSDTLLTKRIDKQSYLLPYGKARVTAERRNIHPKWFAASESLMRGKGCFDAEDGNKKMIGVTPSILHRDTMISTAARLLRLYGKVKVTTKLIQNINEKNEEIRGKEETSLSVSLSSSSMKGVLKATLGAYGSSNSWTEYSAYRVMSCLRSDFFKYHTFSSELQPGEVDGPLYYGYWDDQSFAQAWNGTSSSSSSSGSNGNTHLEKDHPMLRATFVVLQDDKVHLDTAAGVGFLRYMFCTHTSSGIPSLLVSLMQLPSCS